MRSGRANRNKPQLTEQAKEYPLPLNDYPTSPAYTGAVLHCFCGISASKASSFSGATLEAIESKCVEHEWPFRKPRIRDASWDLTLQGFDDDEIPASSRTMPTRGRQFLDDAAKRVDMKKPLIDAVKELIEEPESDFAKNLEEAVNAELMEKEAKDKDAETLVMKPDSMLKEEDPTLFGRAGAKGLKVINQFRTNPKKELSKIQLIGKSSSQNDACLQDLCSKNYLLKVPAGTDSRQKGRYKLSSNSLTKKSGVSSGV